MTAILSNTFEGRRVLVTGANGFLGSNLRLKLAQLGAIVYGTTRTRIDPDADVTWLQADLADAAAVRLAIRTARPDIIFHMAGQTNAGHDRGLIIPAFLNNVQSTVLVLLEALELGTPRVVVTASLEEPV